MQEILRFKVGLKIDDEAKNCSLVLSLSTLLNKNIPKKTIERFQWKNCPNTGHGLAQMETDAPIYVMRYTFLLTHIRNMNSS
jgi:hypothetical protein